MPRTKKKDNTKKIPKRVKVDGKYYYSKAHIESKYVLNKEVSENFVSKDSAYNYIQDKLGTYMLLNSSLYEYADGVTDDDGYVIVDPKIIVLNHDSFYTNSFVKADHFKLECDFSDILTIYDRSEFGLPESGVWFTGDLIMDCVNILCILNGKNFSPRAKLSYHNIKFFSARDEKGKSIKDYPCIMVYGDHAILLANRLKI